MPGNSVQGGGSRVAGAVLLSLLDLLPIGPDLVHVLDLEIAKNMRVAANQFIGNVAARLYQNRTRHALWPVDSGKQLVAIGRLVLRSSRDRRKLQWRPPVHTLLQPH